MNDTISKQQPIGLWEQRHKYYLQEYKKVFYTSLLTSGKLSSYLADIEKTYAFLYNPVFDSLLSIKTAVDQYLWMLQRFCLLF